MTIYIYYHFFNSSKEAIQKVVSSGMHFANSQSSKLGHSDRAGDRTSRNVNLLPLANIPWRFAAKAALFS